MSLLQLVTRSVLVCKVDVTITLSHALSLDVYGEYNYYN